MKSTIALSIILFSSIISFGQSKSKHLPLIIQGQITDCPEKHLNIFFQGKNGELLSDTINLDQTGKFYLKTFKIQQAQRTNIQQNNIQINDIFVAPGYNLTITGNGKDFLSLLRSTTISGIGSESNRYRSIYNSILIERKDTTRWFELNGKDLLLYIDRNQKLQDSITHIVFDKKPVQDMFLKHFGEVVRLNNNFSKLYMLVTHVNFNNYGYEKSVSYVRKNFDNKVLDNLYKDEYLISNSYTEGFIGFDWLNYLINLDYKRDSTLRNQEEYKIKKVNELYQGKVKEYVLYNLMKSSIRNSKSFEKLNDYKGQFEFYIETLSNNYYKESLESNFVNKENELLKTLIGKAAPEFILQSNFGETYRLADFKDKVVYLDLWASWCGPCRAETPSFKTLYNKYKNDNRIVLISIAVNDGINEWKKALGEDKPDWLQLLDQEGTVSKSYVANSIPKFIIIDKKGNIVSFDAPRPSSGDELENILNEEIAK